MKKKKKLRDTIWQVGLMSVLLILLCGCTRKEELLLLSEETAEAAGGQSGFSEDAGKEAYAEEGSGRISTDESGETELASESASLQENREAVQDGVIYVHVCGAVAHPGVYELEAGCRVYEAVEQAGGFSENADQNYVNQAQALEDGVMLVIPTKEETADAREREKAATAGEAQDSAVEKIGIVQGGAAEGLGIVGGTSRGSQDGDSAAASDGRININTASEAQLCEIPGVGATRAEAIAAYRETHGPFKKPEDIMKVSGIKEGMYEKIKDSISVK